MKLVLAACLAVIATTAKADLGVGTYGFPDDLDGVQSRDGICAASDTVLSTLNGDGQIVLVLTGMADGTDEALAIFGNRTKDEYSTVTVWSDGLWCITGSYTTFKLNNAALSE